MTNISSQRFDTRRVSNYNPDQGFSNLQKKLKPCYSKKISLVASFLIIFSLVATSTLTLAFPGGGGGPQFQGFQNFQKQDKPEPPCGVSREEIEAILQSVYEAYATNFETDLTSYYNDFVALFTECTDVPEHTIEQFELMVIKYAIRQLRSADDYDENQITALKEQVETLKETLCSDDTTLRFCKEKGPRGQMGSGKK